MTQIMDLTGKHFGRLLVIEFAGQVEYGSIGNKRTMWRCRCSCGKSVVVAAMRLRKGETQSCGCLHREILKTQGVTHGMTRNGHKATEYRIWRGIKNRCYNKNEPAFKNYGARGITVCDRWRDSFENFYADMGPRPSKDMTLDRTNNDLGYSPENCRWATATQQARNSRHAVPITIGGETRSISEWAEKCGIGKRTLWHRLRVAGMSPEEAIRKPLRTWPGDWK